MDLKATLEADPRALGLVRTLIECGGFYRTPYDTAGLPLGPYIGYADKEHCGNTYIDIGALETEMPNQILKLADDFAALYHDRISELGVTAVFGIPTGGVDFSFALACKLGLKRLAAQKVLTGNVEAGRRGDYELVFDRHKTPPEGTRFLAVEDIFNNGTSTGQLAKLASRYGAVHTATAAIWNRSVIENRGPEILSVIRVPLPQWPISDIETLGYEILPKARDARTKLQNLMERFPLT